MSQISVTPTAVALHDLSSFGRCALTVISPTLSAMGVQVCPVPTALLSTHTGGFDDFCFEDTTPFLRDALAHFIRLGLQFDAVYSGFLGSDGQIRIVEDYLDAFPKALKLVDPVLGDDGKLYATITDELVDGMRRLCRKADLITPNITEAAFLLNEPLQQRPDDDTLRAWLERLSEGKRSVVITGIPDTDGIANVGFDSVSGERFTVTSPLVPERYPGTGDIFASVLLGGLLRGRSLHDACVKATDFTHECIAKTVGRPGPRRNGVELEACLGLLTD